MTISTWARFQGGPAFPNTPGEEPSPGIEIVKHLVAQLPNLNVPVGDVEDIQYAHQICCTVLGKPYEVLVSYDWVATGWWEVFYSPRLSWIRRLLGASEEAEMRLLTSALAAALNCLPGIGEIRWYPRYTGSPSGNYTLGPTV